MVHSLTAHFTILAVFMQLPQFTSTAATVYGVDCPGNFTKNLGFILKKIVLSGYIYCSFLAAFVPFLSCTRLENSVWILTYSNASLMLVPSFTDVSKNLMKPLSRENFSISSEVNCLWVLGRSYCERVCVCVCVSVCVCLGAYWKKSTCFDVKFWDACL